jgi:hypothetical protein
MIDYLFYIIKSAIFIFLPWLSWLLFIRDFEKSLTIYFNTIIILFIINSLIHINAAMIMFLLSTIVFIISVYRHIKNRKCLLKIKVPHVNEMPFILFLVSLIIISWFIPITQNWDFYTYYFQIVINPMYSSTAPLFNNIQLAILWILKDFLIIPRVVSAFFIITFFIIIYKILHNKYLVIILLLLPSFLTVFVHENNYLELSSLVALLLFLNNYYKYGINNIYTLLSIPLLFFTKGNISFVLGPIIALLALSITFIQQLIRKRSSPSNLKQYFAFITTIILVSLYFYSNIKNYNAINFEIIFLFRELTLDILHSSQWYEIVSGRQLTYSSDVIFMKYINMFNPNYGIFIAVLLIIPLLMSREINIVSVRLSSIIKVFNSLPFILLAIYFVYIASPYFPYVNTYTNIFVIRYYLPIILLIYIIIFRKITDKSLLIKLFCSVSLIIFGYMIYVNGPFMKEHFLLAYMNNLYIYHMLLLTIIIMGFIFLRGKSVLNIINKIIDVTLYLLLLIISMLLLFYCVSLIPYAVRLPYFTDSTEYNCVLHNVYPSHFSVYFTSYCENDNILINISNICPLLYSIGGIYSPGSIYTAKIPVVIRGGHLSFIPFILNDIKLYNYTIFIITLHRLQFLKEYLLPDSYCLQVPLLSHREGAFYLLINELKTVSPSFSILYSFIYSVNPYREFNYYSIYIIKNTNITLIDSICYLYENK